MPRIAIVTDSSADLEPHIAAAEGIVVVQTPVRIGAEARRVREYATPRVPTGSGAGTRGTAEAPADTVDAFTATFSALVRTHDGIVAVLLSSRLGDAVAAARQARARLRDPAPIEIVDSRSASLGLGFQAMRAARLAREEGSADSIAAALRDAVAHYHVIFSVENVDYLRQSGRIGRSAAMIADALQLKPLLRIDEGQFVPYERARTRPRAIGELAEFVRELSAVERCAVLSATHSADASELMQMIASVTGLPPERISVNRVGPVIANQVGPDALGIAVVESEPR